MTIRYKCPECGAALNINDELAGTEGNCPRCQTQFVVPKPESEAVPQTAAEVERSGGSQLPSGPLSDDDIGNFLSSDPSPSSSSGSNSTPESDDELPAEQENPFDQDRDEAEDERRLKKQKSKRGGSAATKPDAAGKSASIAQRLMGRGEPLPEAPEEPAKKKRKQFGGREERHPGELTSYSEVIKYFAKLGWPYVLGISGFLGFCIYLFYSSITGMSTPPLVQVSGTVTIDGKPLKSAIVKFVPLFEGPEAYKQGTSSMGMTDADGKYTLVYANNDGKPVTGAVIAKHQVQIQLNDLGGGQLVPPRYSTSQSELKVEVKKGIGPLDFPLKSDPVEKTE